MGLNLEYGTISYSAPSEQFTLEITDNSYTVNYNDYTNTVTYKCILPSYITSLEEFYQRVKSFKFYVMLNSQGSDPGNWVALRVECTNLSKSINSLKASTQIYIGETGSTIFGYGTWSPVTITKNSTTIVLSFTITFYSGQYYVGASTLSLFKKASFQINKDTTNILFNATVGENLSVGGDLSIGGSLIIPSTKKIIINNLDDLAIVPLKRCTSYTEEDLTALRKIFIDDSTADYDCNDYYLIRIQSGSQNWIIHIKGIENSYMASSAKPDYYTIVSGVGQYSTTYYIYGIGLITTVGHTMWFTVPEIYTETAPGLKIGIYHDPFKLWNQG